MKKSKFTEEQIVGILRETDRDPVATVAKRHGVSEQAIYTWKKRFGSFQPDDVRRLKQLEQENARLKKLVAERDLEIEVMSKRWLDRTLRLLPRGTARPYSACLGGLEGSGVL
jgi:putative transposase